MTGCPTCNNPVVVERTEHPFEDVGHCERCGALVARSWSRAFGPRFEEQQQKGREHMKKNAKAEPLPDEPAPPVECSQCACGARLVLDTERTSGQCEECAPALPAAPETEPPANPVDVPLPFPVPPPEPFDFHAAFCDIAKKTQKWAADQKVYEDLASRAKDAKKQWEAAASTLTLAILEYYDRKARENEQAFERDAQAKADAVAALEASIATPAEHAVAVEKALDQV